MELHAPHSEHKEKTMANWFESVTKTLADGKLTRRGAMKTAAGITAAAALASLIPGEAFAASHPDTCTPGTCSTTFAACGHNKFGNCFCFEKIGKKHLGQCGCNSFCASVSTCSNTSQCPSGSVCITNTGCGCTTGVCIPKCNKTCQLDSSRSGRTAA